MIYFHWLEAPLLQCCDIRYICRGFLRVLLERRHAREPEVRVRREELADRHALGLGWISQSGQRLLHVVDGLLVALGRMDDTVAAIRASKSVADARTALEHGCAHACFAVRRHGQPEPHLLLPVATVHQSCMACANAQ